MEAKEPLGSVLPNLLHSWAPRGRKARLRLLITSAKLLAAPNNDCGDERAQNFSSSAADFIVISAKAKQHSKIKP